MAQTQSSSAPVVASSKPKATSNTGATKTKAASPKLVEIGVVTRPHGILGEVKVAVPPGMMDVLAKVKIVYVGDSQRPVKLRKYREHQNAALLTLEGVNTRNDSEILRGVVIFVDEKSLPVLAEGEYYARDLIDLLVSTPEGVVLGHISEVLSTGSNDVYVIQMADKKELLLPALDSVIKVIDFGKRTMTVIVPDGL